jgi:hypothetical protein
MIKMNVTKEEGAKGVAEYILSAMLAFVVITSIAYYATGVGGPPPLEVSLYSRDGSVFLKVISGEIPKGDWEYLLFDERVNPPIIWTPGPADIKEGEEILLGSGLKPATYRVQIKHAPTLRMILDEKVTVY